MSKNMMTCDNNGTLVGLTYPVRCCSLSDVIMFLTLVVLLTPNGHFWVVPLLHLVSGIHHIQKYSSPHVWCHKVKSYISVSWSAHFSILFQFFWCVWVVFYTFSFKNPKDRNCILEIEGAAVSEKCYDCKAICASLDVLNFLYVP
jgi:hypothetical protein